jgi:hypothetical protein
VLRRPPVRPEPDGVLRTIAVTGIAAALVPILAALAAALLARGG